MSAPGRSIVLIGMMGAGKSSVGRELEKITGAPCLDIDFLVAQKVGASITEIFAEQGEDFFREAETNVVRDLALHAPTIVITGGGVLTRETNAPLLKRLGVVVFLETNEETLWQRVKHGNRRPLLRTPQPRRSLGMLLRERNSTYRALADIRIETAHLTPREIAFAILRKIQKLGDKNAGSRTD